MHARRAARAGVALALVVAALTASTPGAVAEPTAPPVEQTDEQRATQQAVASGQQVEVTSARTDTTQVFAQPDGAFNAQISQQPVRTRVDGVWKALDPTLRRVTGRVVPAVAPVELSLSGGQDNALLTVARGRGTLSMTWPGTLPTPTLFADTATYPEVVPGVDLRIRAGAEGFSHVLVVKTRQAATSTALKEIRFGLGLQGLRLRVDGSGGLSALDTSDGQVVLAAAPPLMWDSAVAAGRPPAGSPFAPGENAARAPVGVQVGSGSLTLAPDQQLLTAASTVYPVMIDPSWTYGLAARQEVNSYRRTDTGWHTDPASLIAVGFQNFQSPTVAVRTFLRFTLDSRVWGTTVRSATLRTYEIYSSSCTPRPVRLYATGSFSASTTWNTQPAWGALQHEANVARGYSASCPGGGVEFDATSAVAAAAARRGPVSLGLRAANEADPLSWKKFQANPTLTVVYNRTPTVGARSMLPSAACVYDGPSGGPRVPFLNTSANLRISAKLADADGGNVTGRFEVWQYGQSAPLFAQVSGPLGTGSTFTVTVPAARLANGSRYLWRVNATDGVATSAWSSWCQFTVDTTRPNPPTVASADGLFPVDSWGGGSGEGGRFTLGANGSTDVAGFYYSLDSPTTPATYVAASAGAATVSLTPAGFGPHHLYAQAVDRAGSRSQTVTDHRFYVRAPADPRARWRFEEGTGTVAGDTSGGANHATLRGATFLAAGRVGSAVHFDGDDTVDTGGPVLNARGSYALSAWVRLADTAPETVVLSQDGVNVPAFQLGSMGGSRWGFQMVTADTASAPWVRVLSTTAAAANRWTHLAGVYDSTGRRILLYVNGVLQGTAAITPTGTTTGPLHLGRGQARGGAPASFITGDVDEVDLYQRVLFPAEVGDLYNQAALAYGSWPLDEASGTTAADSTGQARTGTLSGDATFSPTGGRKQGAVRFGPAGGAVTVAGPGIRTDRSFTVASWANLADAQTSSTVLSQAGTGGSGFAVRYEADTGQWCLTLDPLDADGPSPGQPACSSLPATTGQWVHLTAMFDQFSRQLRLYVDGYLVGIGAQDAPWHATAGLQFGRERVGTAWARPWRGSLDDVQVYSGILPDAAVAVLAAG